MCRGLEGGGRPGCEVERVQFVTWKSRRQVRVGSGGAGGRPGCGLEEQEAAAAQGALVV